MRLGFLNWGVNCLGAQSPYSPQSSLPLLICSTFHMQCTAPPPSFLFFCGSECQLLALMIPLEILRLILAAHLLSQKGFLEAQANTRNVYVSEVPTHPLLFFFPWVFFPLKFWCLLFLQKLHLTFVLNSGILLDYILESFYYPKNFGNLCLWLF